MSSRAPAGANNLRQDDAVLDLFDVGNGRRVALERALPLRERFRARDGRALAANILMLDEVRVKAAIILLGSC